VGRPLRARGVKVGFIGITASKMPSSSQDHCDFILNGEPEAAVMRLAPGDDPVGNGRQRTDRRSRLAAVPRWDLVTEDRRGSASSGRPGRRRRLSAARQPGMPGVLHVLSRTGSSPAIAQRSIANIADELERLCDQYRDRT
jgi:hypothetical protein